MKVSLREFKTRTNQLVNILDQADKGNENERGFLMRKVKSATFDLLYMESDLSNPNDVTNQIETCKRGLKLLGLNHDTNN